MGKLGEEYTIYVLEHEGYEKGFWFETENFGSRGREDAFAEKKRLEQFGRNYRVVARTIFEEEVFE